MLHVDVISTPDRLATANLTGRTAVVIDVLRATSTITQALSAGASAVIPASSPDEAVELKSRFPDALLGGEIKGRKIPGFDLGNSPSEYTSGGLQGRTIIMTTSNGTKAIVGALKAGCESIILCCFLNLTAVQDALVHMYTSSNLGDISIVCSGSHGEFSLEDFACAGALSGRLASSSIGPDVLLTQEAQKAVELFRSYGADVGRILEDSPHGQYLKAIGFEKDLEFCARLDALSTVPYYRGGAIITRDGRPDMKMER